MKHTWGFEFFVQRNQFPSDQYHQAPLLQEPSLRLSFQTKVCTNRHLCFYLQHCSTQRNQACLRSLRTSQILRSDLRYRLRTFLRRCHHRCCRWFRHANFESRSYRCQSECWNRLQRLATYREVPYYFGRRLFHWALPSLVFALENFQWWSRRVTRSSLAPIPSRKPLSQPSKWHHRWDPPSRHQQRLDTLLQLGPLASCVSERISAVPFVSWAFPLVVAKSQSLGSH